MSKNKFDKMKIFKVKQIAEIDRFTIENEPVSSDKLMERAANAMFKWIENNVLYKSFTIFAGTGNNGGDGLVIARLLSEKGAKVNVIILESEKYSPDCLLNKEKLKGLCDVSIFKNKENKYLVNDCIIDALFGSGLSRPLSGNAAEAVELINISEKFVISVDIPSGLPGEDCPDLSDSSIVCADVTLTLQFPKISFFYPESSKYTGEWHIIPIGLHANAINNTETKFHFTTEEDIKNLLLKRSNFSHKGNYGHALIFAGSSGKFGAAVMAAKACIHSGAGLTTVYTDKEGMPVIQAAVPEAMGIFSENSPDLQPFNAVAAGPGIGTGQTNVALLEKLIRTSVVPMVLDADALNILSDSKDLLAILPQGTVITPHPKEFSRLAGESRTSAEMLNLAVTFALENKIIVVLKGAYTRVITPDGRVYFNSTGNPGMAKGGSGDVLTGIIVSLIARGYNSENAAILGVYLHGLAGDIAAKEMSAEYISACDIISYLCHSFKVLYQL